MRVPRKHPPIVDRQRDGIAAAKGTGFAGDEMQRNVGGRGGYRVDAKVTTLVDDSAHARADARRVRVDDAQRAFAQARVTVASERSRRFAPHRRTIAKDIGRA